MPKQSIKDLTKNGDWTLPDTEDAVGLPALQLSCLMRIADSMDLIAENYNRLIQDRNFYQRRTRELEQQVKDLEYSRAGYKAALTKLRNKQNA